MALRPLAGCSTVALCAGLSLAATGKRADASVTGYRELRTRRAAGVRFIDFELLIDRRVSFENAHEVTELVKARIREVFPRVVVTVHAEPVVKTT